MSPARREVQARPRTRFEEGRAERARRRRPGNQQSSFLIQILLPLTDNSGEPLPRRLYQQIQSELTQRFKGLTAYSRAPAEGLWKPRQGTKRDEIIVYEVMATRFDVRWWRRYRTRLEQSFRQESIIIRAQETRVL
jgi:hypothetical protein